MTESSRWDKGCRELRILTCSMSFRPSSPSMQMDCTSRTTTFSFSLRVSIERLFGDMTEIPMECVNNSVPLATFDLLVDGRFMMSSLEILSGQ